jgi:hypothetical protein
MWFRRFGFATSGALWSRSYIHWPEAVPNNSFNRTPLCRSGSSERYRGGAG